MGNSCSTEKPLTQDIGARPAPLPAVDAAAQAQKQKDDDEEEDDKIYMPQPQFARGTGNPLEVSIWNGSQAVMEAQQGSRSTSSKLGGRPQVHTEPMCTGCHG